MKAYFNNYHVPLSINSPKAYVKVEQVIYDGTAQNGLEDYSVALIRWCGTFSLAIRWNHTIREESDRLKRSNIKKCLGLPSSFARPVWFVLPKVMHLSVLNSLVGIADDNDIEYAKNQLNKQL